MKEENNSPAGVWIAVAAGLILLYLLSPGPVLLYYTRTHKLPGRWLDTVYAPILMLKDRSNTLDKIYVAYFKALGVD